MLPCHLSSSSLLSTTTFMTTNYPNVRTMNPLCLGISCCLYHLQIHQYPDLQASPSISPSSLPLKPPLCQIQLHGSKLFPTTTNKLGTPTRIGHGTFVMDIIFFLQDIVQYATLLHYGSIQSPARIANKCWHYNWHTPMI